MLKHRFPSALICARSSSDHNRKNPPPATYTFVCVNSSPTLFFLWCDQEISSDDVILDVGCGDGRVLVTMAKILGCRGIGIDISQVRLVNTHLAESDLR